MSYRERDKIHRGFSLIELLIVILIVSTVYFLGFEGIDWEKKKPKALTPLNLKSTIISSEFFTEKATLLCINQCRTCYLRKDVSSGFQKYESPIDLTNIKAYTLDNSDRLTPIEYGRYQDAKICLLMNFYNNGSSTQVILENDKASYFLPAFFGKPKTFSSPEEAKEYWLRNSNTVSDSGEFY